MLVIGIVKGDEMFDWHSEYMVIQARQQEMASSARMGRLLAEAKSAARPIRAARLRDRLGAALVSLGRRLQKGASEMPAAPC